MELNQDEIVASVDPNAIIVRYNPLTQKYTILDGNLRAKAFKKTFPNEKIPVHIVV